MNDCIHKDLDDYRHTINQLGLFQEHVLNICREMEIKGMAVEIP